MFGGFAGSHHLGAEVVPFFRGGLAGPPASAKWPAWAAGMGMAQAIPAGFTSAQRAEKLISALSEPFSRIASLTTS